MDAALLQIRKNGTVSDLGADKQVATGKKILLVPTEHILLIQAQLPQAMSRSMAVKAAPYLIEEFLSNDPESLHFAYPDNAPFKDSMPAAVCSPSELEEWLASVEKRPAQVIPDVLALPYNENEWAVLLEEERCLIRYGAYMGMACDKNDLAIILELLGEHAGWPDKLVLFREPEETITLELPCPVEIHPGTFQQIALFDPVHSINLLQGPFGQTDTFSNRLKSLMPIIILALLWWLVITIGGSLELKRLEEANRQLEADLKQAFSQLMPEGTRMVNPRVQAERQLASIQQAGNGPDLLQMLSVLGSSMAKLGRAELSRLEYRNDRLELQLNTNNIQLPEQLVADLGTKGLKTRLLQLNLDNGVASASIRIEQ